MQIARLSVNNHVTKICVSTATECHAQQRLETRQFITVTTSVYTTMKT